MSDTAAIILAAGKGTRMGSAPINKVCFDCAGVPVIRRIVRNMREGGVERFVIVVGHRAESVMAALDGEPGVFWAYQSEQKGTGHAAGCGLAVLNAMGFSGRVIISMGDKIVAPAIVRGILSPARPTLIKTEPSTVHLHLSPSPLLSTFTTLLPQAVLGVQRVTGPTSRGHVIFRDNRPVCIVEHKDAVRDNNEEALSSPYVNAAFYAFDAAALSEALKKLKADNAQGELYLTDTIAQFAAEGTLSHYEVENPADMLTYSTRPELRAIAHRFLRRASEFQKSSNSTLHLHLTPTPLLDAFVKKYGDKPCVITSAPGRINLMGRHIEHRGGSTNMMATRQRMTFVVAPRTDDLVRIANLDPAFPPASFKIGDYLDIDASTLPDLCHDFAKRSRARPSATLKSFAFSAVTTCGAECAEEALLRREGCAATAQPPARARGAQVSRNSARREATCVLKSDPRSNPTAAWLDFLDSPSVKSDLAASRGHWLNYVKGAVLRFQMATDMPLCGMDIMASGDIPVAAGLSSSSALVVATAEAIVALNELNLSTREFVDLCGEGEWFVGSRGGAGDHAAMKCSKAGCITHLKFKPFEIGESVPFPASCAIVVVNSGEQAKKSEGARETFNARIADYETALAEVKRHYPNWPLAYFRDLAFLPEAARAKALACLTGTVRGVAKFGMDECRRAEDCLNLLKNGDFASLGAMMKESHDGDRLGRGEYECSTPRIDALCDRLNAMPGVYGSQLVGAGLGGSVIALVDKSAASSVVESLSADGYSAFVSSPEKGSSVQF